MNWAKTVCRAGAIVLLVGFWFDGGLFKLATGSVFWILLELGRVDRTTPRSGTGVSPVRIDPADAPSQKSNISEDERRLAVKTLSPHSNAWLTRAAWITAAMALALTLVCLVTPFLPLNNFTLAIARHWLVPPKAVPDLNFLATLDPRPSTLRVLLEHASLANYNRELVNWKLDDDTYRKYILWPDIYHEVPDSSAQIPKSAIGNRQSAIGNDSALRIPHSALRPGDLSWRRELWEYFYPPIRHETDPQSAAQIVLKFLHERIAVVPVPQAQSSDSGSADVSPASIDDIWRQRKADPQGFEALTVAAFRSVGIPARLNVTGHPEIFAGGQWQKTVP